MLAIQDPALGFAIYAIAIVGFVVGTAWVYRIYADREDADRSYSRSHGEGGGGSWLPGPPDLPERPTLGWLLTRGAMGFALCAVLASVAGPLVLTRWDRILDSQPVVAALAWAVAIAAAIIGTRWILAIGWRSRDDGHEAWRSQRR